MWVTTEWWTGKHMECYVWTLVIPVIILSGKEIHAFIFINFVSYCCDCKSNKFSDNWKLGKFHKQKVLF